MPQTKSAAKRLRQNIKIEKRNRSVRSALKTRMRKLLDLVEKGAKDEAQAEIPSVYSLLDKAVAQGVVKKNYVSRQKSNLARKVNSLTGHK